MRHSEKQYKTCNSKNKMDDFRQKPVAGQTQSIFVLKAMQTANPIYEYDGHPEEVAHTVGYFSSLAKALDAKNYCLGDLGWHYWAVEEAFLDPPPIRRDQRPWWLPFTVSETKETSSGPHLPDWQFVPEESLHARYGVNYQDKYKTQEEVIKELQAQVVKLQNRCETQAQKES